MTYKDIEQYKIYQKKYHSEKIICECGKKISKSSKNYHIKTENHKFIILLIQKKT